MILEGKVIKCIGIKEGTSQSGKDWKLAQYLIDTTTNEQYPKQVAVEVFGEDRINELSLIPDEQVKEIAMKFADAFVKQAQEKGSVNLFGLEMGQNAFEDLKVILTSKFEEE